LITPITYNPAPLVECRCSYNYSTKAIQSPQVLPTLKARAPPASSQWGTFFNKKSKSLMSTKLTDFDKPSKAAASSKLSKVAAERLTYAASLLAKDYPQLAQIIRDHDKASRLNNILYSLNLVKMEKAVTALMELTVAKMDALKVLTALVEEPSKKEEN
jgi:hypothetical protein